MRGYIVNEKDRAMNSTAEEKTHMYERMAEKIYKRLIEGKGKLFKRIKMPSSREFNVWHLPALHVFVKSLPRVICWIYQGINRFRPSLFRAGYGRFFCY